MEVQISRSVSEDPFNFEIMRVDVLVKLLKDILTTEPLDKKEYLMIIRDNFCKF